MKLSRFFGYVAVFGAFSSANAQEVFRAADSSDLLFVEDFLNLNAACQEELLVSVYSQVFPDVETSGQSDRRTVKLDGSDPKGVYFNDRGGFQNPYGVIVYPTLKNNLGDFVPQFWMFSNGDSYGRFNRSPRPEFDGTLVFSTQGRLDGNGEIVDDVSLIVSIPKFTFTYSKKISGVDELGNEVDPRWAVSDVTATLPVDYSEVKYLRNLETGAATQVAVDLERYASCLADGGVRIIR